MIRHVRSKYSIIHRRGALICVLGMLLLSSVSFASTAWCNTQADLASYGTTGTSNGCYEIDQTFGNFAVSDGSSGTGSTAQSTTTVDILGSSDFSTVTSPWTVTSTFSGATMGDWEAGGANTEGTITYLTNTTEAYFTSGTYPTPSPGDYIAITSMSLTVSGHTGGGSPGSMAVTEIFCIGAELCTVGDAITLSATFGNNSSTPTYGCSVMTDSGATCGSASSANPIALTFAEPVITLDFSDNYNLVGGANMTAISNLFNTDGTNVPEPSMFLLLGVGLGGALLRLRVYRKSS